MKNEFKIKKCIKCGATVEVLQDCTCENCGIKCCGEEMVTMTPNTVEASAEKHIPTYQVIGNYIVATVNHVMEDDHYIEYIALSSDGITAKKYLEIGKTAQAVFPYVKGSKLYGYCNKHGLWEITVE